MEAKIDGLVTMLMSNHQLSLSDEVVGFATDLDPSTVPDVSPTPTSTDGTGPSAPSVQVKGREGRSLLVPTLIEDHSVSMKPAGSNDHRSPEVRLLFGISPNPVDAEVLNRFRQMLPYFPFMVLPASASAQELLQERPFLYHCIMTVSSWSPTQQAAFGEEMMKYLGEQMLVEGNKSIDLLLGIFTYAGWCIYLPGAFPKRFLEAGILTSILAI
jgi:hypothetical protein